MQLTSIKILRLNELEKIERKGFPGETVTV